MVNQISIPDFFAGKSVFITGGSGFMGKVLIEKLLRSCPDLDNIYMLIRDKKNKSAEERIQQIVELPLFKILREQSPEAVKKIKPVLGNVMELGLGISEDDRKLLIEKVSIVYHAAASVRFDDPLTDSIILNTRGTREVVMLAREMKNLNAFIHFSTTYCHSDKQVIDEKMYPPHIDWRDAIKIAENVDRYELDKLTKHFINPLPNTYTFAKSLSEHVVKDLCEGVIPVLIYRPSIVISTWRDPIPGWIDNFNGPVGLLIAVGKGVIHSALSDPDVIADYVPVDIVTRGIIVGTWKKVITENPVEKNEVTVYNYSQNDIATVSMRDLLAIGANIFDDYPLSGALWFPKANITRNWYLYFFRVVFYHLFPALLIDGLLKLFGHKPMLFKLQRKIYIVNLALEFFSTNQWTFLNKKAMGIENDILPSDLEDFGFKTNDIVPIEFITNGLIGARTYLMKDSPDTLPQARIHHQRLKIIYITFSCVWYLAIAYFLWSKIPYHKAAECIYGYLASPSF